MNAFFKWIGGATWIVQIDSVKIACDPVLCPKGSIQDYRYFKTTRLNDPVFDETDFTGVNLWLLTHNHEDHLDRYGLKMIPREATIISHESLKPLLLKKGYSRVRFLGWHEDTVVTTDGLSIRIKAIPAVHAKRRIFGGMVGNGNGYFLEISRADSAYSIYVTGDSVYDRENISHIGSPNIDLIIANSGSAMVGKSILAHIIGRITNNANDLTAMAADMRPKKLIPVHWGTFTHYSENITSTSFKNHDTITIADLGERIALS